MFACPALDSHWTVAKGLQLRVGFALDGLDLLSGFVLSISCLLSKMREIWQVDSLKLFKLLPSDARFHG